MEFALTLFACSLSGMGAESLALPDGGQYVGDLKDGKPYGVGKCSWPDGSNYEGEWRAGVMHGRGTAASWHEPYLSYDLFTRHSIKAPLLCFID